ncbi:flavorubredoxin [Dokdonella fugitiva]|jgi:flavorubredoxin|uniref:Flavorubredoxin n=1 Tax=Dokdonella fugitiva TaxID=328517 RepID=A0A839F296_9GAMM|nr:MBL fold metallo-hydrolase [Dokdonella fugitiva]MBA8887618.1 flavorubredoxin [Dokdonella fugitiva]
MATELFRGDDHLCVAFTDLVRGDDGVQANQFLVVDRNESALIDPGGALLYTPLNMALTTYVQPRELTWVLASHQDPDIIGSVDSWLLYTGARVVCSRLWGRFIPHSVPHYQKNAGSDRYLLLPDEGAQIPLGRSHLQAVPAHFLHSVGNFQFYDPASRILFSGDLGASMVGADTPYAPVEDFDAHIPRMAAFHRRYMASNRACRWWARRARRLDIDMIVPQHGLPIRGKDHVERFIGWIERLECGVDLLEARDDALF